MNYEVIAVPTFRKQLKKLFKKYHSLKSDIASIIDELEKNPTYGTQLGKNCYKIRIAITSKGKGKSGGARIITNFVISAQRFIYFLFMTNRKKIILQIKNLLNY